MTPSWCETIGIVIQGTITEVKQASGENESSRIQISVRSHIMMIKTHESFFSVGNDILCKNGLLFSSPVVVSCVPKQSCNQAISVVRIVWRYRST